MKKLTHFDASGNAVMVDVGEKEITCRTATAEGTICASPEVIQAILQGTSKKGDVLGVARVAGIMAVKQTAGLIPMCHTLLIQKAQVDFKTEEENSCVKAVCTVKAEGKTGVEMEALTAVSAAALTIYDMCKAVQKDMEIGEIRLCRKTGGKSGDYEKEW